MLIGIDLDGVLFDSEMLFRVYSELYDMLELKQNSIIDNSELRFQERYNWTKEQINDFLYKYYEPIVKETNFMPGAKQILKMLKNEGHKFIVITARDNKYRPIEDLTKKILIENDMDIFDKYIWGARNKAEVCKNEKIDLMIEDYCKNCEAISKEKIKTIYLKAAPSPEMKDNKYLKTLYNWGEIYRYIKEIEG